MAAMRGGDPARHVHRPLPVVVALVFALALALAPIAASAVPVEGKHVRVELVADAGGATPGGTVRLGVRFVPEHEWHVYWRNPGDSGEAPRIEWTLPPGLTAGELEWPAPARIPVGPLVNFGYEGETLLAAPAAVASDVRSGTTLPVRALAKWLVCNQDECIPGSATLTLSLPVGGDAAVDPDVAELFRTTRARLPLAPPPAWRVAAEPDGDRVALVVQGAGAVARGPNGTPFFFAADREALEPSAEQVATPTANGFRLALTPRNAAPATLAGVLRVGGQSYAIAPRVAPPATGLSATPLALAFAGGLLLNLMPCVFPVLALKALALVGLGGEALRRVRRHGLVYALGVVASFWTLAAVLLAARAGGAEIGWGFQLQSPTVIALLAGLFFWMALVLLDVVTIGGSIMGVGQHLTAGDGDRAAFFTGVLATVVATPCTAPFMGTAIGYALGQPAIVAFAVFTSLGLGLAFPYVLVTFVPALARRLPRPGAWMETLKQFLAFPLLATVVWLVTVASVQAGPQAVVLILMGLLFIAFGAWIASRWAGTGARLASAAAIAAAVLLAFRIAPTDAPTPAAGVADASSQEPLRWEPFSTARVAELRAEGRPVFVDFTAAWCVTCQVNKKVALETAEVAAKMKALGVAAIRADWTSPDPEITRALQEFGRDGVPLYVLYSGKQDDPPSILPQILTPSIVITALERLEPPSLRRSST
jgi:thiol:disulfide interchange protein DsbD